MSETDEMAIADRVTSIYGDEHRGTVVNVGAFADGTPMYRVRRDSDGFVWIGMPSTVILEPAP
jgi:hypothetical protein